MEYSDHEYGSGGELEDDILGPEDLFNDEADEGGNDEQSDHGEDHKDKPEKEDTKEEVEKKVKPRRVVKSTRVTLNSQTLKGQNGLSALKKMFSNFKFKGNGHEKEDLTKMMGVLQQWMSYKLCPMYEFESCMLQIEALGRKKDVQTLMKKYRLGMDEWGEKKSDDEDHALVENNKEITEDISRNAFDMLLEEEMANVESDNDLDQSDAFQQSNNTIQNTQKEPEITLTQEQLERIERNRKLAEERRLARLNSQSDQGPANKELNMPEQEISLENINLKENR